MVLISQYSLYIASGFMVNVRTSFGQRPSYQCPSMFCDTPMVHHIRRFVHGQGCVQIILKELDSPVPGYQHTILTYSWCRICKQVNMPCCYSISYNIIYFFICIVLFGRGGLCYFGFIRNWALLYFTFQGWVLHLVFISWSFHFRIYQSLGNIQIPCSVKLQRLYVDNFQLCLFIQQTLI